MLFASIKVALSTVNRFLNEYTINIAKNSHTVSAINNDQVTPLKPNKLFKTNKTGIITVPYAIAIIIAPRPCPVACSMPVNKNPMPFRSNDVIVTFKINVARITI